MTAAARAASWRAWWAPLRKDGETLIFMLKVAAAAVLTLWLAYRFSLDSPSTAVITVFIVMQSRNGMVLAKGFYRALGTLVGSLVGLGLVAAFPQSRWGFLLGLALWVGLCTGGARYFRNFQAYAFVLAGYTAALVGIPAVLQPAHAFDIGIARVSDVMLGIGIASILSAVLFPQSLQSLLYQSARSRFGHFLGNSRRVVAGGVPRAGWAKLHLQAIAEVIQLDSYRSSGIFESQSARRQNGRVQQMIAEMMAAASSLHLLNSQLRRLRHPPLQHVLQTLQPLLDQVDQTLARLAEWVEQDQMAAVLPELDRLRRWVLTELGSPESGISQAGRAIAHTPQQALARDSTILLLTRFLAELHWYVWRYLEAFHPHLRHDQLPGRPGAYAHNLHRPAPWDHPQTELFQPLSAALRGMVVVGITAAFWLGSDWPSGPAALIIVAVLGALFSTFPNPVASVRQMGWGISVAFLAALVFTLLILPHVQGFPLLALGLLPFLLLGPLILYRSAWPGMAAGYGIFFPQLAIPPQSGPFDYLGMVNTGIAEVMAVLVVGWSFLTIFPMGNWLERRWLAKGLRQQVVEVCRQPLGGLRAIFERDTREYLRLLVADPGGKHQEDARILRSALRLQELGEAVLHLRLLLRSAPELGEGVAPLLEVLAQHMEGQADRSAVAAALTVAVEAAESGPGQNLDTRLHALLAPARLLRIYLQVIGSVLQRLEPEGVSHAS